MCSEWKKIRIDQIAEVKSGKRLPLGRTLVDEATPFPYIRLVDVMNGKIQKDNQKFLTPDTRAEIKRYVVNTGDVCLAIVGHTIGMVFYATAEWDDVNLTENAARITNFRDVINSRYLYYYLTSPAGKADLLSRKIGSAQGKLPLYNIRSLEIPLPSRAEQDVVVTVLDVLSARIELLRETTATLEAIAQALFKSWFVDFDPVRAKLERRAPEGMDEATASLFPDSFEESELGLVPTGWRVGEIGDVVDYVGGGTPSTKDSQYWEPGEHAWTTPKDLSGLKSPALLRTERLISSKGLTKVSSGLLPAGTLLLSSRAPIGYLAIAQMPLAINQGYIAMLPSSQLPPLYMLFWCRQNMEVIKSRANGSTFMEISKKAFSPIPSLVPPAPVLDAFMIIASQLFSRLVENEKQAQTLVCLRDALLPRLISGQLRVSDTADAIQEAA